jgi:hypothetical protein
VVAKAVVTQATQTVLVVALAVVDDGMVAVGLERQIRVMRVVAVLQAVVPLLRRVVVAAQVLLVKPVNQLLAVLAVMVLHLLSQAPL